VKLDGERFEDRDAFDFDFESKAIKGLMAASGGSYQVVLDNRVFKSGKQSLRLEYRIPDQKGGLSAAKAHQLCLDVMRQLERSAEELSKQHDPEQVQWAIQNARVVAQCMELRSGKPMVRDRYMADNVEWILSQNPSAKIVLWAHNGHVAKRRFAMGEYLDQKFGDKHLAMGFATTSGSYQAIGVGGLSEHKLQEPPTNSIEHVFKRAGVPRFILDLRQVDAKSDGSAWLAKPKPFRSIGAMAMDRQFAPHNLSEIFDAVIYIEETTSARPIKR
jgi:erythromycin esterase-like protein